MKISVIIPSFNSNTTLGKCLKALEKQSLKPAEVIIIDDGSNDGPDSIINQIREKSKIVKLVLVRQNHQGVSQARNNGAKRARNNILAFIDSDCIPGKNWLKNLSTSFKDPEVGAVGGGYSSGVDNSFWQRFSSEELYFRRRKRRGAVNTLLSNNMACRKICFWQVGGFSVKYPVCEDMLLSYQISRKNKVLWLDNNGVRHHFKRNLCSYLRHQFFFGKESARFFLENPQLLVENNHQGKELHLLISMAFFTLICFFTSLILALFFNTILSGILLIASICLLTAHFFLYIGFLFHLKKKGFPDFDLPRAYFISFLRDFVASLSFFSGLALYIKRQKL